MNFLFRFINKRAKTKAISYFLSLCLNITVLKLLKHLMQDKSVRNARRVNKIVTKIVLTSAVVKYLLSKYHILEVPSTKHHILSLLYFRMQVAVSEYSILESQYPLRVLPYPSTSRVLLIY